MRFFNLAKAADISPNEIIFMSDVSGDDRIFSVSDLPAFALGEILSVRPEDDEFRLEIKADDGIYEVAALPRHKFAIYRPDEIAAKNLSIGDRVLLRGDNALPVLDEDAATKMSCVSEVLKISKNRKSELEVTFKLSSPLPIKLYFGPVELPFWSRPLSVIRTVFSPDDRVEISYGGYA